jgi:hypothetical protein
VAADGRGKGRARRVCNRSGDPPVGTLGRGSAGQNAEGAEPRVERCPYAFFRGREKKSTSRFALTLPFPRRPLALFQPFSRAVSIYPRPRTRSPCAAGADVAGNPKESASSDSDRMWSDGFQDGRVKKTKTLISMCVRLLVALSLSLLGRFQ